MKIGIINFHWGTNYGAVLQAYAFQTYLKKIGNDVVIINYKPTKYDMSILTIFTSRALFSFPSSLRNLKKENVLNEFRLNHLRLTKRYRSIKELKSDPPQCDVYISGSDQVLNPSFTLFGEGRRSPASTYFLDFGDTEVKRFGYAVSFGCTVYPEKAKKLAEPLLENFNMIGVRENTGIDILKDMKYFDSCVVPDPTLLLEKSDYDKLISTTLSQKNGCYIYMLRNRTVAVNKIKHIFQNTIIADTNNEYSLLSWISNIKK